MSETEKYAPMRETAKTLSDAKKALDSARTALYGTLADAQPDTPPLLPDGTRARLSGPDRGVQKQLVELTGFTGAHLRKVTTDVRVEREKQAKKDGRPVRRMDREKAFAAVPAKLKAVKLAQDSVDEAKVALGTEILAVFPFGVPETGVDSPFPRVLKITKLGRTAVLAMRREARDKAVREAREAAFLEDDRKGRGREVSRSAACDPRCVETPGQLCLVDESECSAAA